MGDQLKVLFVSSECFPLVKTGGLADVVGALPLELGRIGIDARPLLPNYRGVAEQLDGLRVVSKLAKLFGGPARLLTGTAPGGLRVFLLDAPELFDRSGGPYSDTSGHEFVDNDIRFAALSLVGAQLAAGSIGRWKPALVHAHDWQTGLVPTYLHLAGSSTPSIFTIHNLAFQGIYGHDRLGALALSDDLFTVDGVEFHGRISLLKAGIQFSNVVTTVSPTYAQEILTQADGAGMDGVLRAHARPVSGIINGIDTQVWDPERDPLLAQHFGPLAIAGKAENKAALQRRFGLPQNPDTVLLGVVSRLTHQKGFDLLIQALSAVIDQVQLVVLGSGDQHIEATIANAAVEHPDHVGVVIGYDEALAHHIQAGADVILVPSRFEPCGLTQLSALRYGALPLVARVGGLADTVIDANSAAVADGVATGFVFAPVTAEALQLALQRMLRLWSDRDTWATLRQRAMTRDVGWSAPARAYAQLYTEVITDQHSELATSVSS